MTVRIPLDLTTITQPSDGAVRVLGGVAGPAGGVGPPGDLGSAIFPGYKTYPANTVTNTLKALIDRKTEDSDFPDFTVIIDNKLI